MTFLKSSGEQHVSDFFIGLVRVSCARAKIIHDLLNWLFFTVVGTMPAVQLERHRAPVSIGRVGYVDCCQDAF